MKDQHDIKTTEAVEEISFADLYVSELNCRSIVDEAGIETLAANIRDLGLIHNLAGLRDAEGRVGIVAGGRRLRALALLQDDQRFHAVPVRIAPNEDVAKAWAASENHLREQPHAADEVREYARMEQDGIPVPAIALAFGVSEAHVRRRLKLAGLPENVLAALRADEITLGAAACFTICDDDAHALAILERVRDEPVSEAHLRRLLKPASVRSSDRRAIFVGEEAYVEAGGHLTRDLFAEEVLFDDPDCLDTVFVAKLGDAAARLQSEESWKWVSVSLESYLGWYQIEEMKAARLYPEPGVLTEDEAARYDKLAALAEGEVLDDAREAELEALQIVLDGRFSEVQKALSGAIIYVDPQGALCVSAGLVAQEDQAAAIAAGILTPSKHQSVSDHPKPAIPANLQGDLGCIATGARQSALLDHPDLLLDLLAFQLSGRMGYRRAFGLREDAVANRPDQDDGYAPDKRLTEPKATPKDPHGSDLARGFRAFRKQDRQAMRAELTRQLAALVSIADEKLGALIDKEAKTSIREVWSPTAAGFFKRVRGSYLDDLHRDLLGISPEHPSATTFARLKKAEKAERLEQLFSDTAYREAAGLTKAQIERIDAWLPENMG